MEFCMQLMVAGATICKPTGERVRQHDGWHEGVSRKRSPPRGVDKKQLRASGARPRGPLRPHRRAALHGIQGPLFYGSGGSGSQLLSSRRGASSVGASAAPPPPPRHGLAKPDRLGRGQAPGSAVKVLLQQRRVLPVWPSIVAPPTSKFQHLKKI